MNERLPREGLAREQLSAFLASRQNTEPVQTYDELQAILRGSRHVPLLLASIIESRGQMKVDDRNREWLWLSGNAGKQRISASLDNKKGEPDRVTLVSTQRTLPLFRYRRSSLVTLHLKDLTWDQAVQYKPTLEAFMPFNASPEYIDFWASKGEHPIYTDDSSKPSTTTGQIAREASASALQDFNGFLDITISLVDDFLGALE